MKKTLSVLKTIFFLVSMTFVYLPVKSSHSDSSWIKSAFKIQNFRLGTSYQMFTFYHRFNREFAFNEIIKPLPDFQYDFTLNPKIPFRTYSLDSNNNYVISEENPAKGHYFTRVDWQRGGLDLTFDFSSYKKFSFWSSLGLLYGKANMIEERLFSNTIDTFPFRYDLHMSQDLEIFTSLKTLGYSISLGAEYQLGRRWSLGGNLLFNHSFLLSSKSYLMEYEGGNIFFDRGVCGFFCQPVDEYFPIQKQELKEGANLYLIDRKFSGNLFDAQFMIRPKYKFDKRFSLYFQTGFYLGGKHLSRTLWQDFSIRPHILFFGVEYLLSSTSKTKS